VVFRQFSPNSRFLLMGTLNNTLRLWDYVAGKCVKVYRGHTSEKFCAFAAFGVHDGAVLCGGEDRGVRLWDLNRCALRQLLPGRESADAPGDGHCDTVVALDVHPTRRLFASGALDADRTVKIWTHEEEQGEPMAQG
jgi:COMPASS component SWD3